jgi:hypothetical protein
VSNLTKTPLGRWTQEIWSEMARRWEHRGTSLYDPDYLVHARIGRHLKTVCESDLGEMIWTGTELAPCDEQVTCLACLCNMEKV